MGNEKLLLHLLSLLLIIPIISSETSNGSCIVEREILDIEEDDDFWLYDDDGDFYADSKPKKEKKITYKYSILCENVILNPELSLQSQITGNHNKEATQATDITFTKCTLPTVSVAFLKDMNAVTTLDISTSSISSIEPGALNMPNLLDLVLNNNNLTEIKEGTFDKLSNVTDIHLKSNQISSFESFKNCRKLTNLHLDSNNITTIKEEHFQNLKQLEWLCLSNNNIYTIHPNAFASLVKLKYMILMNNALETLPGSLFKQMDIYTFRIINLSNNRLKEISFENYFTKVSRSNSYYYYTRQINLSYNHLTSIPRYLNNVSPLAKDLFLGNNNIKTIAADDFNGLKYTENLYLSHNNIDMIEIGAFRQMSALETLDLSSNKLKELKSGVFTGLNNVQYLNLSYNEFIHFDSTSFFTMASLNEINFSGNYLHSLNTSEFHFQKLQYISLDFHHISCPALAKFLKAFTSHRIIVRNRNTFLNENVRGIACSHAIKPTTSTTTVKSTTTVSTTVSSTTLPVSTTESTTTNESVTDVPGTTTATEINVTEKSKVLEEPHTSKTSHTILIVTIVFVLACGTGVAVWFGRKYYHKRNSNSDDSDAQYRLVNILQDAGNLKLNNIYKN